MICETCKHLQRIDKDGLCMTGGCPVLVLDNGKPTKNYNYCKKDNNSYGEMAYRKEVNYEK